MFRGNFIHSGSLPLPLVPWLETIRKILAPSSLYTPYRNLYSLIKPTVSLLFSRSNSPRSLAGEVLQALYCLHGSLLDFETRPIEFLSSWVAAPIYWGLVYFLPRCKTLHFPLLNFMMFLSSHFSSLLRYIWKTAWPFGHPSTLSSFVTGVNLLIVHSAISSKSLMKMLNIMKVLNRTGSRTVPWGTSLADSPFYLPPDSGASSLSTHPSSKAASSFYIILVGEFVVQHSICPCCHSLSLGRGSYQQNNPGTSWIVYMLMCCPSKIFQGGWRHPWRSEPSNLRSA